jgi:hypothetical protein
MYDDEVLPRPTAVDPNGVLSASTPIICNATACILMLHCLQQTMKSKPHKQKDNASIP